MKTFENYSELQYSNSDDQNSQISKIFDQRRITLSVGKVKSDFSAVSVVQDPVAVQITGVKTILICMTWMA